MSGGTLWTKNPGNHDTSAVARNEILTITELNQIRQIANDLPVENRLALWDLLTNFFSDQKLREEEKLREKEETKRQQTKIREEEETKRIHGMSAPQREDFFKAQTETQQLKIREDGETTRLLKKEETRQLELKKKGETFGKFETTFCKICQSSAFYCISSIVSITAKASSHFSPIFAGLSLGGGPLASSDRQLCQSIYQSSSRPQNGKRWPTASFFSFTSTWLSDIIHFFDDYAEVNQFDNGEGKKCL